MGAESQDEMATVCERPKRPAPEAAPGGHGRVEADSTVVRPLAKPPALGDVVAEKYRLVRALGRGGMGRIFAADHLLLGTTVALKFMHPHLARERGAAARFQREARAAAVLKSANAARIIDVDQLPSGELYIVMEYLDGTSLETLLVDGRGLPVAEAVLYTAQACDALAEAHAHSIVHRDVKPANLFLTRGKSGEPVVKVLDFGLAKSTSVDGADATGGKFALGTPYYMAPEQITGASAVDARTDVWAIGATLYELLSGRLAFGGANAAVVFDAVLRGTPAPLSAHRADVPDALVAIVARCLTLDPAGRFQSVRELARALDGSRNQSTAPAPWRPAVAPPPPSAGVPTSTARFVSVPAPPPPPASIDIPSTRVHILSLTPPTETDADATAGPTTRQTVLAALAGPALIAIAAGVMALVLGSDVLGTDLLHPGRAQTARSAASRSFITAKSGDPRRAKAERAPEKPEKTDRQRKER